jgi:predicted Zn finger-like uncharacterized protein
MILTCPACATRYRVADQEFEGSIGRTVRCANCGYLWYQDAAVRQSADAGASAVPASSERDTAGNETAEQAAAAPMPPLQLRSGPTPTQPQRPPRQGSVVSGLVALIVLVVAAIVVVAFVRHQFYRDRPSAAGELHAASGQAASVSVNGLVIRNIRPARNGDGLIVDGEIANTGDAVRAVPRLRVALRDTASKELLVKIVDPPKAELQPGEVVQFETPFANPPGAATGVVVTFASS